MSGVGHRERHIDWSARTSGTERYVDDLPFKDALTCRILRSPIAHGRISKLDTQPALSLPGVAAVITASDFPPGRHYRHLGNGFADRLPMATEVVRYVGEEIAAVAAENPTAAEEALGRIRLRISPLPSPISTREALASRAPKLHARPDPNVPLTLCGAFGDLDAAFGVETFQVSESYRYPAVAHACMEPHSILASWDSRRELLEIWASTQSPLLIERELANILDLRPDQVVCREVAVGGGFGVKSKVAEHEAIAGRLAMLTNRPVRCVLTRSEEFGATKTRHGVRTTIRATCDESGILGLIDADVVMDNGAYNHYGPAVMKAGVQYLGSMYRPEGVQYRARLVDTAKAPGGPYRGYGSTQAAFALESAIDELADLAAIDPIQMRIDNANLPDTTTLAGARVGTCGLVACLEAVRAQIGWSERGRNPRPWHGIGIAAGMHGSGSYAFPDANRSESVVGLRSDGTAIVWFGSADAGTGQRTILAQIVAEELGLDVSDVEVVSMDGETTPFDMGSWSSRGTHYTGHATRMAAAELAQHLAALAHEKFGDGQVTLADGVASSDGDEVPLGDLVALSDLADEGLIRIPATYIEERADPPGTELQNKSASYSFAAHAAEVSVDPQTGKITVLRYIAAHDVGAAINPTLVEGQIRGGVVMALGGALGEEIITEGGRVVNTSYLDYKLPRAADVPKIDVLLVGTPDPAGPYGAKSVGEIPMHPVAPAIANAVFAATGLRLRQPPFTPDKVVQAIAERDGRRRRHHIWKRPSRWWVALVRSAYPRGLHRLLHGWGNRLTRHRPIRKIERIDAPRDLAKAQALVENGSVPVGGGTDLLPQRDQGLSLTPHLVALSRVGELTDVQMGVDGVTIGSAVTLSDAREALSEIAPMVAETIDTIASVQVRAAATVAGNLLQAKRCWFFRNGFDCYKRSGRTSPCYAILGDHRFFHAAMGAHRCQAVTPSDLATSLVGLDATILLGGPNGTRRLKVEDLYTGPGESQIKTNELVHSVHIPETALHRAQSFRKLALSSGDFAVTATAVTALIDKEGRWMDPRIVLGGVAPTPWRARTTEEYLHGRSCDSQEVLIELNRELNKKAHPLPGNSWKLDAAVGLVEQALVALTLEHRDTDV